MKNAKIVRQYALYGDLYSCGMCLCLHRVKPSLTLFRTMEFSIKVHTIKSGWSIVYIEGS